VVIPTLVLAESYRGSARSQAIDSLLPRHRPAIITRDTDRTLARFVGAVLHAAGADSTDIVDAHLVAVVAEVGGGLILTADQSDLERLAASYRSTVNEPLR
jgi:predicted nucleic acid-binding protein